jgi:adenosylcobinamide hydrolase
MPDPDTDPDADRDGAEPIVETTIRDGVLRVHRPDTRFLSSGWNGGFNRADAAYNVSVPTGFSRTDLDSYLADRRERAGFREAGPMLLTGLALDHARGARSGPVCVLATAGLSNPAVLPVPADSSGVGDAGDDRPHCTTADDSESDADTAGWRPGTVNLIACTTRALDDASLATLLGTCVEAKTAALLAVTGFPGTTSDALVVGCDPAGTFEPFAGSATAVGAAARACVRDAVTASLRSRYAEGDCPTTLTEAEYGVRTTRSPTVFQLTGSDGGSRPEPD